MTVGRPRNKNRDYAEVSGDKFYEASACWCGNTKRYTKGGRCVDCAIAQARTQSVAKRKPKMATPAQVRIANWIDTPQHRADYKEALDPISQQIAELAARENEITDEEAA